MRRRLVRSTAAIALAAVLIMGVPLGIVQASRERADASARLEREADAIATAVDDRVEAGQPVPRGAVLRILRSGHQAVLRPPGGPRLVLGPAPGGGTISASSGSRQGTIVRVVAPYDEVSARIWRSWLLIGLIGSGAVLAAAALAAVQARRLARPLEDLATVAGELGSGDFSSRAAPSAVPEIDAVGQAMNSSARRIARLVGRQRDLASDAAHQLRTPLAALRVRLEGAQLRTADPELAPELEHAVQETDRLAATVDDLLRAARDGSAGDRVAVPLAALAADHAGRWRPRYAERGRSISVAVDGALVAHATRGGSGQALDVLLENALRHGVGLVRLTGRRDGGHVVLRVQDEGAGVPPEARERIFARGESLADGTGLGLHLARTLVESDGGRLVLGGPAAFDLILPAFTPQAPREPA